MIPTYVVGLDLGQANDYTALIVLRPDKETLPTYDLGHIERIPIQTRYPEVVAHTKAIVATLMKPIPQPVSRLGFVVPPIVPRVTLVVDYTGVGRPVADMLLVAGIGCPIVLVTITSGDSVNLGPLREYRVPKRDLASVIQRLLQEKRLNIPSNHPMAATLTTEMIGFRAKINLRGHDSYGAGEDWRSAPHDDLVLALALAAWQGERNRARVAIS